MSTPKKHARYAASNSARWIACPGSLDLSEQAPPQLESSAANEGTKAHELMELALNGNIKDVAKFFKNDDYPKTMLKDVQGFVNFVRSQLKPGFELLVEERIELTSLHPTEAFGTVDVAIIEPFGALHIIDFKYGYGYVDHNQNSQMIYYALGLAHKHNFDFEKVMTTIYQPRTAEDADTAARTSHYSIDELKTWEGIFKKAIAKAENADLKSDLNHGEHCKYCPAKIICPAITSKALNDARLDFDDAVLPEPKAMTKIDIARVLSKATYLELWIDEVKAFATKELKEGKKVPGWHLEPTRAQKVWAKPDELVIDWPEEFDKADVGPYAQVLKSPAEVTKDLKEAGFKKKQIDEFINANIVHVSSGTKLAQTTQDYAAPALEKSRRH